MTRFGGMRKKALAGRALRVLAVAAVADDPLDAVAGHRHDIAARLQRLDDAQLLRRMHAREDGDARQLLLQFGLVHALELGAPGLGEAQDLRLADGGGPCARIVIRKDHRFIPRHRAVHPFQANDQRHAGAGSAHLSPKRPIAVRADA